MAHTPLLHFESQTELALRSVLDLRTANKILELYQRWGANRLLEDRAAVEHGIEIGRGAIWLRLTPEQ